MTNLIGRAASLAALLIAVGALRAADQPTTSQPGGAIFGWRMDGSGVFPDAQPALTWSQTTNIVWRAKLAKGSFSSPVIAGDALFCCAEPWTLLCLDRSTGAIRWQKSVSAGAATPPEDLDTYRKDRVLGSMIQKEIQTLTTPYWHDADEARKHPDDAELKAKVADEWMRITEAKHRLEPYLDAVDPGIHPACGWSVYTPITDGRHVWAVFADGVAICCDLQGNLAWASRIERPPPQDQFSESPLLVGGKLVVHLSDLKAFDAASGKLAWSVPEIRRSFASPVAAKLGQDDVILTPTGWLVRLADGKVLAKNLACCHNSSPIVHGDIAYFIEGDALALKLPATDADPVKPTRLWQTRKICDPSLHDEVFCASPLWLDGIIYYVSRIGLFVAIDASDGTVLYTHQFEGNLGSFTSIASAGGHVFVGSANGATFVVTPGRTYQEAGCNHLAPSRATPFFMGTRMYARSGNDVLCIGQ